MTPRNTICDRTVCENASYYVSGGEMVSTVRCNGGCVWTKVGIQDDTARLTQKI